MKDVAYTVGHENPDTDFIVSVIAYAQLKQKLGINAIACRLGKLSPETDFVLKKFQVPKPVYIQNVRVKLYDVPFGEPLLLRKDDTIGEAWGRMGMCSTNALLVVGEAQKLIGVVSLPDMTSILMSDKREKPVFLIKNISCENIHKVLRGGPLYEYDTYQTNGRIYVPYSRNAEYSDINYRDSIVVVDDDLRLQKRALSDEASCMTPAGVDIILQGVICMAKGANCIIIKTPLNMFRTARNVYRSPDVKLVTRRKTISLNNHVYIDDVYKQMSKSKFRSYPVVNNQSVMLGSVSCYHLSSYRKKKFILVDHNKLFQSVDDSKEAGILGVVGHHRISDMEATTPARFRNEIIGSTVSIIARMYKEAGLVPEVEAAAIICCVITSNTMNFNSPTTAPIGRELARELAAIAGVELDAMAKEVFGAVAVIKGRTVSEILYNDFKEYNTDGKRIAIGQIDIADEQEIVNVQDEIHAYMEKINKINKFDSLMMYFTAADDSGNNLMFIGTLSYLVDGAFKEDIMGELYFVDGVISREKQIIPTPSKRPESMQGCGRVSFRERNFPFSS